MQRALLLLGVVGSASAATCGFRGNNYGWLDNAWNADPLWLKDNSKVPTGTLKQCIEECQAMDGCRAFSRVPDRSFKRKINGKWQNPPHDPARYAKDNEEGQCWYKIVPEGTNIPALGSICGGQECAKQWRTYVVEGCNADGECHMDTKPKKRCQRIRRRGMCKGNFAQKNCYATCNNCDGVCTNRRGNGWCKKRA